MHLGNLASVPGQFDALVEVRGRAFQTLLFKKKRRESNSGRCPSRIPNISVVKKLIPLLRFHSPPLISNGMLICFCTLFFLAPATVLIAHAHTHTHTHNTHTTHTHTHTHTTHTKHTTRTHNNTWARTQLKVVDGWLESVDTAVDKMTGVTAKQNFLPQVRRSVVLLLLLLLVVLLCVAGSWPHVVGRIVLCCLVLCPRCWLYRFVLLVPLDYVVGCIVLFCCVLHCVVVVVMLGPLIHVRIRVWRAVC